MLQLDDRSLRAIPSATRKAAPSAFIEHRPVHAPREAIEYVCQKPQIESIVFGASSRANIRNTRDLTNQAWGRAA